MILDRLKLVSLDMAVFSRCFLDGSDRLVSLPTLRALL